MTNTPPGSPLGVPPRPMSAMIRPPRSNSRMSMSSKQGGSRASDEDAKTAVKVAVRVRPPLKPTDPGFELIPQRFQRSKVQVTSPTSLAVDAPQGRKLFVFDRVFGEDVNQEGVWEYLDDSVNSFLQGYNVSILAYGQSGAGKSYTMGTSGPNEQNDTKAMGIVPRASQLLFEKLGEGSSQTHNRTASSGLRTPSRYSASGATAFSKALGKDWEMKATYVEIYNEHLRDLLVPDSISVNDRSAVTIREDAKGRILLTGLHQVNINSIDDLLGALNFGSSIRQTDATAINAKSSRSHAVFSLNLVQRKSSGSMMSAKEKRMSMPIEALSGSSDASVTVDSKLHFVDLAGSERLKNTGASGERAKEGISINAGLASLGKVISQLSSRQSGSHVSYRDSKLTRLLQDSLGGNAITYMIACVTPAEFHLSETLNTVQYAQRARAIQSKPRIQQVTDETDKQAVIERLKAEVNFLRQQINNTDNNERRSSGPQERSDRQNEREIELQDHLLDVQESYTALSQRHAKLISELTKASDFNGDIEDLTSVIGETSVERLKRSHSFAESVEQVVLEYEKTIQSLESSLSTTRSSLANTESSLLERETKCAYIETVNSQLQARVQKMMDREASTENYLHDLETKLDGHTSGEEKNAAIVAELRKEIARARENEASCEDYISTLEERLAEADQDMELMQREVNRLEHVVDRQRSLGKLDNLLHELDHIQNGTKSDVDKEEPSFNGFAGVQHGKSRKRTHTLDILTEAVETAIPESDDDLAEATPEVETPKEEAEEVEDVGDSGLGTLEKASAAEQSSEELDIKQDESAQSPAQSRYVADKLENVTQELLDLRIQHDSTVNEYDLLNAKYEESLRALAQLQDAVDEAKRGPRAAPSIPSTVENSRPVSFLEDGKAQEQKNGAQSSSSQLLSSELSLAGEPPISPQEPSEAPAALKKTNTDITDASDDKDDTMMQDMENMRKSLQEHQDGMSVVTQKYAQLQAEHEEILSIVDNLKLEVQRTKSASPTSPSAKPSVIRRMTSQNLMTADRAHRSLASLRNIAAEELESKPDTMQNFEMHLNNAMHELHTRMERVQSLEAENKSVKKEMETKTTIISGLTRERSSLQGSSPVDASLVSQMREQVFMQETQIKELQEAHEAREKELTAEIQKLNELLESYRNSSDKQPNGVADNSEPKIAELEFGLSEWKGKHETAVESLQTSEKQLQSTLSELETALASIETLRAERTEAAEAMAEEKAAAASLLEKERAAHQEVVDGLKRNIEEHESTISKHMIAIGSLEKSHADAQDKVTQHSSDKEAGDTELETYRSRVSQLEADIESHKSAVDSQKSELQKLQESHQNELKELETRVAAAAKAEHESQLAEERARHEEAINALRSEVSGSKDELTKLLENVTGILNAPVTVNSIEDQLQDIISQKQHFSEKYSELIGTNEDLLKQLESKQGTYGELEKQVEELKEKAAHHESKVNELAHLVASHEDAIKEKDELIQKKEAIVEEISVEKQKSVRLVEELEEQITNTFDQHHNRLSVIQAERHQALEDANAKIGVLESDIENYRMRIDQLELQLKNSGAEGQSHDRTSSMSSNLRKSASAASLPSPPPAIPLPPLPSIAATANTGSISPPSSRHTSKELVNAQLVEDQEARIRTIEKHLHAEKQLTATLEEALGDLEAQSNKVKADMEGWKKKAWQFEDELTTLRKERNSTRLSIQAVEEERNARREAEAARAHLEERMNALNKQKKKKSTLNCF